VLQLRLAVSCMFIAIVSCSTADTREEKILKYSVDKEAGKYAIYLVNPEQYTTKGAGFHSKYYQYLVGIARSVIEEKKFTVIEKSIGFYYDKREAKKDKLYLGIDISMPYEASYGSSYPDIALVQLQKYLTELLYIMASCGSVFRESEIVGSVIGLRWERDGVMEIVTIWVDMQDVLRYEKKELTFDEIIQRNFVTNNEGKLIKLLR
jgi:hypothetical protein